MLAQMENHQVIAENLAASSVRGYRRSQGAFESYLEPSKNQGDPPPGLSESSLWPPSVPQLRTSTNFSQGGLETDGYPTHLAISGDGFFAVQRAEGGIAYTRNGAFHLNGQGELLTTDNGRVLGDGGNPIVVPKPAEPILVTDAGDIVQGGNTVGKIQIADFRNPSSSLRGLNGSYFVPNNPEEVPDSKPTGTTVHQGFLESSNVNSVQEMVSLIQATRSYEANQKMLQSQDGSLEQVIRLANR